MVLRRSKGKKKRAVKAARKKAGKLAEKLPSKLRLRCVAAAKCLSSPEAIEGFYKMYHGLRRDIEKITGEPALPEEIFSKVLYGGEAIADVMAAAQVVETGEVEYVSDRMGRRNANGGLESRVKLMPEEIKEALKRIDGERRAKEEGEHVTYADMSRRMDEPDSPFQIIYTSCEALIQCQLFLHFMAADIPPRMLLPIGKCDIPPEHLRLLHLSISCVFRAYTLAGTMTMAPVLIGADDAFLGWFQEAVDHLKKEVDQLKGLHGIRDECESRWTGEPITYGEVTATTYHAMADTICSQFFTSLGAATEQTFQSITGLGRRVRAAAPLQLTQETDWSFVANNLPKVDTAAFAARLRVEAIQFASESEKRREQTALLKEAATKASEQADPLTRNASRPMSKSEAAAAMGYKGDTQSKVRKLNTAIKNGLACMRLGRQQFVFSCDSFPEGAQSRIRKNN